MKHKTLKNLNIFKKERKQVFHASYFKFQEKGFTLIETLVSMTLFLIIIGVVIGSFTYSIRAQRVVLAEKEVTESINFAVEYMSRQIRVAQRDQAGVCIAAENTFAINAGQGQLTFLDADGTCVRFEFDGADPGSIRFIKDPNGTPDTIRLTNFQNADVNSLQFKLLGEQRSDDIQPRVTISISAQGVGGTDAENVDLDMQTTVTGRRLDVR